MAPSRSAERGPFDVHISSIPADDFDTLMRPEPLGEPFAGAFLQQVDDVMPFQIHQDGAVALALFPGPIIYAEHTHRRH